MSTEIVKSSDQIVRANAALPDLEIAHDYVERLVENADEEALHDLRSQADAVRLYEQRNKNLENANHFAHLKLLAEAGLGELSLARDPSLPTGTAIMVRHWRTVAIGQKRGRLQLLCDSFSGDGRTITTTRVARTLERDGWTYVDKRALQKIIDARVKRDGTTRADLARELGFHPADFYPRKGQDRLQWSKAVRMAGALGVDPATLPPKLHQRRASTKPPVWLTRERKRSGGDWDRAYGYFRQCLDQFQHLAPNSDASWDEAYAHLYAIEEIIGRQMDKARVER